MKLHEASPCRGFAGFPNRFWSCQRALTFCLVGRLLGSRSRLALTRLVGPPCRLLSASRWGQVFPLPPCRPALCHVAWISQSVFALFACLVFCPRRPVYSACLLGSLRRPAFSIHLVGLCRTIAASRYGKMSPLPPCLFCCSLWWRWGKMCPLPPCHFFVFSFLVAVGANVAPTTLSFFVVFTFGRRREKCFLGLFQPFLRQF